MKSVLTFLYVEDERQFEKSFVQIVNEYFRSKNFSIHWKIYHRLDHRLNFDQVDACFFDIVVDNKNLLDVLHIDRINVPVIVISQFENYVYDCVHLQIFDFVRKSHLREIYQTLHKLLYLYEKEESVVLKYNDEIYKLDIQDIIYIKKQSHYIAIYKTDGEMIELWKGYHDIFKEDYPSLLKVHRSYVINMRYCLKMDGNGAYLKNVKEVIPVSHRVFKKIQKEYFHSLI